MKHFNQIFRYLARHDFPLKYTELHEFMVSSLNSLFEVVSDINMVKEQRVVIISLLSTVKIVIKEYASRRLTHS